MGNKKIFKKDYFLGFDIGTDSVGYAVTDCNYNVLKFNGKSMWGSRLFDSANTAVERRNFRCNTRRLQRRRWRIELLQELFAEEISKIDPGFYQRLKESSLKLEDKKSLDRYSLFADHKYTDKNFYEEFPTIYHLRKALILGDKHYDVRLVYLAIHNIMKNRGHFLFNGSMESVTSFSNTYDKFKLCMKDEFDIDLQCSSLIELQEVLKNREYTKKDKNSKVMKLLSCSKEDKQLKAIIGLICGLKVKLEEVFEDESLKDVENSSVSFAQNSYDDVRSELEGVLQERCGVLDIIKSMYDWTILSELLKGGEHNGKLYLSIAKVKIYEEHKSDLALLKNVVKSYSSSEYKRLFNSNEKKNYCSYVGFMEKNHKKISLTKCSQDEFYSEVKKIIKAIRDSRGDDTELDTIEKKINEGSFMPLQVSKDNGVIPYQVNYIELKEIINNAKAYLPFLSYKDSEGIETGEKILRLFQFRIPYYIGPLNTSHMENSWMVRKENGRITPWNFENKVDVDESAKLFIRRMTNKCTYLIGKDVLPQQSLLYSEFMVLNEINNIKINGEKLSVELKCRLYDEVFKRNKKVTGKMLLDFLKSEGIECKKEEVTGFDKDFKASLRSYIDFKNIFGEKCDEYNYKLVIEKIILFVTLYGAESAVLKRVIRNNYDEKEISEFQLKQILKLKYDGWGALSKEFLIDLEGVDNETGECFNIIQALRNTNDNLMQLLSQKYTFSDEIDKVNLKGKKEIKKITYNTVIKDLVLSPAVKRAAWQVILIAEEIKKIMGKEPSKIFLEVAREHEESKRTKTRKDKLIELYSKCRDEEREWKKELEVKKESDFRSIKLYLYYTQMGRCMYTGKPIDLSELADSQIYDRDHIYPQSLTKDDSLDNMVLVDKRVNAKKSNDMLSADIQLKMCGFWKTLRKKGFISDEKYNRLMRKTPLTDEELAGFINRQLVETRQSSKAVAQLFKQLYSHSDVVYVKANAVSDFRARTLKRVKVRSLNDLHHAKDAYLNIVVGNVYQEKFTNNPLYWLKSSERKRYNLNRMFDYDIEKKGKIIWKRGTNGTIAAIRKQFDRNDINCTRYETINKGALFNLQIVGAKDNASVPIKKGMDVEKYGGYKNITPAYFALVESEDKKGKLIRTIESVPLYMKVEFEKNIKEYEKYCIDKYGLRKPRIIIPKIKKNALLIVNKFPMNLRGTTGKQLSLQGAVQLVLPEEDASYIKKVEKYIQRNLERKDKKIPLKITEKEGITAEENLKIYDILLKKQKDTIYKYRPAGQADKIEEGKDAFKRLSLENQCIVINEILNLMRCKPIKADLSLINGASKAGNIQINKNITSNDSVIMVNESVTGLFRREIDMMRI